MEELLNKKAVNNDWGEIFEEYKNEKCNYKTTDFPPGNLGGLANIPGIIVDDFRIEDMLSQKGIKPLMNLFH